MTYGPIGTDMRKLADRTVAREKRLLEIERDAISRYRGLLPELNAALGVLRMGDHLGWKPLLIVHSRKTIRKYEAILGIKLKEEFVEEGPSAERSLGFLAAKKLSNFWKAVSGELKLPNRQEID